jgi:MATE family multidrug resistance protein
VLVPPHPAADPPTLTRFVPVLLTATDAVLLGRLGGPVLAAGGLAVLLFGLLRSAGAGLIGPVGDAVSSAVGRARARARAEAQSRAAVPARTAAGSSLSTLLARPDSGPPPAEYEVRDLLRASVAVATVAGAVGALTLLGVGHLLGQDARLGALTAAVLGALAPGLVPSLWFEALCRYRQGMRRPGTPVWLASVAVAAHLGLAWLLGFGAGPMPGFGAAGIGAATSAAYLLGFGLLYLRTGWDRALAPMLSLAGWRASLPAVRLLLRRARRRCPRHPAR